MSQIHLIDLTDADFELLNKALEKMSEPAGQMETLLMTGLSMSFAKTPVEKEKLKQQFASDEKEAKRKHQETADNTIVLRSKLIQLKRFLRKAEQPCPPADQAQQGTEAGTPVSAH